VLEVIVIVVMDKMEPKAETLYSMIKLLLGVVMEQLVMILVHLEVMVDLVVVEEMTVQDQMVDLEL
jgi:hypothetical protein